MTRINIGIPAVELCDEHLVVEYRELPRMRSFVVQRLRCFVGTGPRPEEPTLDFGHMCYFIPYGKWLRARFESLVAEMVYRGFQPTFIWREYPVQFTVLDLPPGHEDIGRPLLRARILCRLAGMRSPRWTNRTPPSWAVSGEPL